MINRFRISNFKCFSDISFEMGRLNLLAGSNGCGKSSVIHALLLLQQSYEQFNSLNKLSMYGKYVNLGLANDIMYDYAETDSGKISFFLQGSEGEQVDLEYLYSSGKNILERDIKLQTKEESLPWKNMEFLSAERIVPQTIYSTIGQGNTLGIHGENAINFLEEYGDSLEVNPCFYNDTDNKSLLYYVNFWLDSLFGGFNLYSKGTKTKVF